MMSLTDYRLVIHSYIHYDSLNFHLTLVRLNCNEIFVLDIMGTCWTGSAISYSYVKLAEQVAEKVKAKTICRLT
jgi:hypothetical protein